MGEAHQGDSEHYGRDRHDSPLHKPDSTYSAGSASLRRVYFAHGHDRPYASWYSGSPWSTPCQRQSLRGPEDFTLHSGSA